MVLKDNSDESLKRITYMTAGTGKSASGFGEIHRSRETMKLEALNPLDSGRIWIHIYRLWIT
jgi:hypothetical protein